MIWKTITPDQIALPAGREEVVFWHFWGGEDRAVVESIVDRFNRSQDQYWVRAIAVPGNNLDAKLFLSIAGGSPPDLVNQDDPVLADWYQRGAILTVPEIAGVQAVEALNTFLLPAAQRLATVDGQYVAIPNGLDIRAMYYNDSALREAGLTPPETLDQLDQLVQSWAPPVTSKDRSRSRDWYPFLPDPRRVWMWGFVFGANFVDESSHPPAVRCATKEVVEAITWMKKFSQWYGVDEVAKFRHGDQSLPGKTFPLLPVDHQSQLGRYAMVVDGQWRVRDIERFLEARRQANLRAPAFGVVPLPYPINGRPRSGWVNGNFFIVPRGARSPKGAWAFARFWIGLEQPETAAEHCVAGGWIPVSEQVMKAEVFQTYCRQHPLFSAFVDLANSPNLFPYPAIPGAMYYRRALESAAEEACNRPDRPLAPLLQQVEHSVQNQVRSRYAQGGSRHEP